MHEHSGSRMRRRVAEKTLEKIVNTPGFKAAYISGQVQRAERQGGEGPRYIARGDYAMKVWDHGTSQYYALLNTLLQQQVGGVEVVMSPVLQARRGYNTKDVVDIFGSVIRDDVALRHGSEAADEFVHSIYRNGRQRR